MTSHLYIFRKYYTVLILLLCASWFTLQSALARDTKGRFVVVIDAGHGGHDGGARGRISREKDVNLNVALEVGRRLKALDPSMKVLYTRSKDVFIGLNERADFANKNKADLFVSIHSNSAGSMNSSARGAETYVLGLARTQENLQVAMKENSAILKEDNYTTKYEGFDPNSSESYIIFEFMQNKHLEKSLELAGVVQSHMVSQGLKNRGVRQAGFLVLRRTSMPSILVELGFMTHSEDEKYMNSKKGIGEYGQSIARAIVQYRDRMQSRSGGGYTEKATTTEVSTPVDVPDEKPAVQDPNKVVMYRIQIHADKRKLKKSNPLFKGYTNGLAYYEEDGMYKYTLYETPDLKEAQRLRRELAKTFKGCFVVSFVDGERVK